MTTMMPMTTMTTLKTIKTNLSRSLHRRLLLIMVLAATFCSAEAADTAHWVGSWACAPVRQAKEDKTSYADVTVRNVVHVSLGGNTVRIKISNQFGATSLTLDDVHVAIGSSDGKIDAQTDRKVTFGGLRTVTIPAGALAVSDPVAIPLPALSDLAVSLHLPRQTLPVLTYHPLASSTNYLADSNQASAVEMKNATQLKSWFLLTGVDVVASPGASAVVAIGDSITDGAHSTANRNRRWTDILAARLHANGPTAQVAVLNEGISGNRILHNGAGTNALERLDRDVLAQTGAKYLVILESINDIRYAVNQRNPEDAATPQQLIWALDQMAIRAHARGLKVYCATLTPFMGSKGANPEAEEMRTAINAWIRTTDAFDAVLDFDRATLDPAHPDTFALSMDSGDHLHPADPGYKAMADSINLKLFQ